MNADGTGPTQLTVNQAMTRHRSSRPMVRRSCSTRAREGEAGNHIWVMNPGGTGQVQLIVPPGTSLPK
jgi:hypothetical protein